MLCSPVGHEQTTSTSQLCRQSQQTNPATSFLLWTFQKSTSSFFLVRTGLLFSVCTQTSDCPSNPRDIHPWPCCDLTFRRCSPSAPAGTFLFYVRCTCKILGNIPSSSTGLGTMQRLLASELPGLLLTSAKMTDQPKFASSTTAKGKRARKERRRRKESQGKASG